MSMGIGNNAASWAQFVKITSDARARTSAPQSTNIQQPVPFKHFADMYLSSQNQMNENAQSVNNSSSLGNAGIGNLNLNHKTVGANFDAYA